MSTLSTEALSMEERWNLYGALLAWQLVLLDRHEYRFVGGPSQKRAWRQLTERHDQVVWSD